MIRKWAPCRDHPHPVIHDPLDGASVVITRPAGTSSALAKRARNMGAQVVRVPGLALRAIPSGAVSRQHFLPPVAMDDWIFTSPAAVRFAFAQAVAPEIEASARVFALGDGTRRALARQGIAAKAPDRQDSEGLLALPELAQLHGRHVTIVGAPGGRGVIAPELIRRGARVEDIHVYQRIPPKLNRRHFDALRAAPDPWLTLLSSGEALTNLVALLPTDVLQRLRASTLVVSSARLAALAREHGFRAVFQAESAAPVDLLAAAELSLSRHRL